jgi:glycosyltransferase involved in cell wall biosynthesis
VRFSDQYAQAIGVVGEDKMAWIYRASDVLLAASKNEGFGIPIVEAQAVGTPVVTTDFTSMPELTWNGIATPPAQRAWTPLDSWVAVPSVDNIYDALVEIHDWSEAERIQWREYGQERAAAFQWDRLVAEYWAPMLAEIEADIEAAS